MCKTEILKKIISAKNPFEEQFSTPQDDRLRLSVRIGFYLKTAVDNRHKKSRKSLFFLVIHSELNPSKCP